VSIQDDLIAAPRVPLRYLVTFNPRPRKSLSDESCYLPMEAISEFGKVDTSRTRPTSEMAQGYSYLEDGDVAYAKVTPCFENGKGLLADGLPGAHAYATTEITVMRPGPKLDARYLAWVLQSDGFRSPGESHMSGAGGLKRVPDAYAAQFRIPHPSGAQQRAIADFLDRETAQIDAFIAKNEQLITLLTERRAGVVDAAFSGLKGHLVRLKYVATVQTGVTLGGEGDPNDPAWPYLSVSNVQVGHIDLDNVKSVRLPVGRAERSLLRVGDVLMTEGGDPDKLGRGALWEGAEEPMLHQNHVFAVRTSTKLNSRYLMRWLDASQARSHFESTAKQTTNLASTNKTVVGDLPLPLPSAETQRQVAVYIDAKLSQLDSSIEIARRAIELARERRAALISAAVTGKIDVGVSA